MKESSRNRVAKVTLAVAIACVPLAKQIPLVLADNTKYVTTQGTDLTEVPVSNVDTYTFYNEETDTWNYSINVKRNVFTSLNYLNNLLVGCDYKISTESQREIQERWQFDLEHRSYNYRNPKPTKDNTVIEKPDLTRRDLADSFSTSMSWLVENGVVHRPVAVTWQENLDNGKQYFQPFQILRLTEDWEASTKVSQDDWMVWLYKATYGTIESRPLIFSSKEIGSGTKPLVEGFGSQVFESSELDKVNNSVYNYYQSNEPGDYYVFVAPDVYELYFTEWLNKKILTKEDISTETAQGSQFLREYQAYCEDREVSWARNQGLWFHGREKGNPLGSSYEVKTNSVTRVGNQYLKKSRLTMMDAIHSIADVLRLTEKDMTKTEASIVTYKYGATYFHWIDSERDRDDVMFLTAKGILNFEDPNEYISVYGTLTLETAFKLLHRVANPDARLNFSEIQLTDQEAFWQSKGYSAFNLALVNSEAQLESVTQVKEEKVGKTSWFGWLTLPSVFADEKEQEYEIVYVFSDASDYMYNSEGFLSDVVTRTINGFRNEPEDSMVKIGQDSEFNPNSHDLSAKVIFRVKAKSQYEAIKSVKDKLTPVSGGSEIKCVIKGSQQTVDEEYKPCVDDLVLVPETELRKLENIVIQADNVLYNKETNTTAVFQPKYNRAIVGCEVIVTECILTVSQNGEIYYSYSALKGLLGSGDIDTLDQSVAFVEPSSVEDFVVGDGTESGEKVYCIKDTEVNKNTSRTRYYYKVSSAQSSANCLYRTFNVPMVGVDGEELSLPITVVVQWVYSVPTKEGNAKHNVDELTQENSFTISDVTKLMYVPPDKETEPVLRSWWDRNILLSNSLCNFLLNTTEVQYVDCGYYCPSVYFLMPEAFYSSKIKIDQDLIRSNEELTEAIKNASKKMAEVITSNNGSLGSVSLAEVKGAVDTAEVKYQAARSWLNSRLFGSGSTFDMSWIQEYLQATNFWQDSIYKAKKGLKSDYLKALADSSMECEYLFAVPKGKDAKITFYRRIVGSKLKNWSDECFALANGTLYEILPKVGENNAPQLVNYPFRLKIDKTTGELQLVNQVATGNSEPWPAVKTLVQSKSNNSNNSVTYKFKYEGIQVAEGTVSSYLKLAPTFVDVPHGKIKAEQSMVPCFVQGKLDFSKPGQWQADFGSQVGNKTSEEIRKSFEAGVKRGAGSCFSTYKLEYSATKEMAEEIVKTYGLTKPAYFYKSPTEIVEVSKSGTKMLKYSKKQKSKLEKYLKKKNSGVYFCPVLLVKTGDYSFYCDDETGEYWVSKGTRINALNDGFTQVPGIAKRITDYVIGLSIGQTTLAELENGTKVVLGNYTWFVKKTKKGTVLTSTPIADQMIALSALNFVRDTKKNSDFVNKVLRLVGGEAFEVNGQMVPLADYVVGVDVGAINSVKKLAEKEVVLCKRKSDYKLYSGSKFSAVGDSRTSVDKVVLSLCFDGELLFVRPADAKSSVYLVCGSTVGSQGLYSTGLNWYSDDTINFEIERPTTVGVQGVQKTDSANYRKWKSVFAEELYQAKQGDVMGLIGVFIIAFCVWICICGFIAGTTKHLVFFRRVEQQIDFLRSKVSDKPFNIVRFISFGIYDTSKPLKISRIFFITVCAMGLIVLVEQFFLGG